MEKILISQNIREKLWCLIFGLLGVLHVSGALPQLIEVTSGFDKSDVVLVAVNQGEENKRFPNF